MNQWIRRRSAQLFILLIAADVALIILNFLVSDTRFHVDTTGGYPELFQYGKEICLIILFIALAYRGGAIFIGWTFLAVYFLLEDSTFIFQHFEYALEDIYQLSYFLGAYTRPAIEFLVRVIMLSLWFPFFVVAFWYSSKATRQATLKLGAMTAFLAFSGVILDSYHLISLDASPQLLPALEDGGEMTAMSMLLAYTVYLLFEHPSIIPSPRTASTLAPVLRRYVPIIGLIAVLWVGAGQTFAFINRDTINEILHPSDLRELGIMFDDNLELVGWNPASEVSMTARQGWGQVDDLYAINLYWRVHQSTDKEYGFYLYAAVDEQGIVGLDDAIGTLGPANRPTYTWGTDQIHRDTVTLQLPADVPYEYSLAILTGAYEINHSGKDHYTIVPVDSSAEDTLLLQHIALYDLNNPPTLAEQTQARYDFDDRLIMDILDLPQQITFNEPLTISLQWEALDNIDEDYAVFVHVVDEQDNLVTSYDAPPLQGLDYTSNWAPNYPLYGEISLEMPTLAGRYNIYMGLYNLNSLERLPVDAPDYRPLVATVEVIPKN